jgi:hypothetical protein
MNERIKELVEKAGIYIAYDNRAVLDKELEFFAELIVKECLVVINQSNGVGDDDVIKISQDVKKHFGVE